MKQKSNSGVAKKLICILFLGFFAWWLFITIHLRTADHNSIHNQIFAATYGVVALVGGLISLTSSRKWGGRKSYVGRALLFFGIGLLAQELGQVIYSVYLYALNGEIPYPSVGDVGYFGSVLFYIYAAWQLAQASGIKYALRKRSKQMLAVILPVVVLVVSYLFFLKGYQFDFSSFKSSVAVFLDFGYPLGQAIYIAIALVTFLLSKNLLGGVMRNKILLVLAALCVQYAADFSFLYANQKQTIFPAGANDFVYLLAYTIMALALISFSDKLPTPQPAVSGVAKKEVD